MITSWYNISADLPRPLPPPMDPYEGDSRIALLTRILPSDLIDQEFTAERYVPIPERVQELYERIGRPTPLRRARGLERAIGTKAKIYYKFEGALPGGSHKLNTAVDKCQGIHDQEFIHQQEAEGSLHARLRRRRESKPK